MNGRSRDSQQFKSGVEKRKHQITKQHRHEHQKTTLFECLKITGMTNNYR
jgi:hypothetical protein